MRNMTPSNIPPPSWPCPACGANTNASTQISSGPPTRTPGPGDVTICLYCVAVLKILPGRKRVVMRESEIVQLPGDLRETITKAIAAIKKLHREKDGNRRI